MQIMVIPVYAKWTNYYIAIDCIIFPFRMQGCQQGSLLSLGVEI